MKLAIRARASVAWQAKGQATLLLLAAFVSAAQGQSGTEGHWPQWRGPLATGVSPLGDPPVTWSETKNVRWKTPLPGLGHSTPVIWGDLIFVTAAEPFGEQLEPQPETAPGAHDNQLVRQRHRFWVLALARDTGEVKWRDNVHESLPHAGGHYTGSLASNSPVCDAKHFISFFGSQGLYCHTHDGELVWEKQLGKMQTKHGHGEGASPVLYRSTVVVNWDHEGGSFVAAFDKATGRQLWRKSRQEVTSWSSPIVVQVEGRAQVVVCGSNRVRGYDLKSGDMIWECGGLSKNVVASPVFADGMVYVGSSYDTRAILGIRLPGAKGDVTQTDHVVWQRRQRPPYVPSPLLYDGALYYLRHYQGILTRLEAKTGEEPTGPFRLDQMFDIYASPVGAAGRLYITDRNGMTLVLQHGEIPRFLANNRLEDRFSASAAVAGNALFLRGEKSLYCLARSEQAPPR